jgi:hypothetical protein
MILLADKRRDANPIFDLFRSKEALVQSTRAALFAELDAVSPRLGVSGREILHTKLAAATYPPLGEMLPWVLADIAQVDRQKLPLVARGWLGVYLYGHLLDQRADAGQSLTGEEQLLGWLLFQYGLRDLHSVVHGTSQQGVLDHELENAVRYQLEDYRRNSERSCASREEYSREKNSCLVACAAAVAAICNVRANEIVEFVRSLRLALQFLDDLGDWESDARENNHTVLLAMMLESLPQGDALRLPEIPKYDILANALTSGALEYTLGKALLSLNEALGALRVVNSSAPCPSRVFFSRLHAQVSDVLGHVRSLRRRYAHVAIGDAAQRNVILRDVDHKLSLVAQGT